MRHHIIPKHEWKKRFGNLKGVNTKENLVWLTLQQHIQAHELLFELNGFIGDKWAVSFLSGRLGKEELLKEICRENQKKASTYWKGRKRRPWTTEEKFARSELYRGSKNPFFGRNHTEESRKLNSDAHVGVVLPFETRQKMSESGKKRWKLCRSKQTL